jgi:hypothetical protein
MNIPAEPLLIGERLAKTLHIDDIEQMAAHHRECAKRAAPDSVGFHTRTSGYSTKVVNGVDTDYQPADISIVTCRTFPGSPRPGVTVGADGWVTFIDFTEDLKRDFRKSGLDWPPEPEEN